MSVTIETANICPSGQGLEIHYAPPAGARIPSLLIWCMSCSRTNLAWPLHTIMSSSISTRSLAPQQPFKKDEGRQQ
eukprot:1204997-Amphidinium_carterae.1